MTQRICMGCGVQLPLREPQGNELVSAWVCTICGRQTVAVADASARDSIQANAIPIPWDGSSPEPQQQPSSDRASGAESQR